jgi:hypothetical protein
VLSCQIRMLSDSSSRCQTLLASRRTRLSPSSANRAYSRRCLCQRTNRDETQSSEVFCFESTIHEEYFPLNAFPISYTYLSIKAPSIEPHQLLGCLPYLRLVNLVELLLRFLVALAKATVPRLAAASMTPMNRINGLHLSPPAYPASPFSPRFSLL